MRILRSVTDMIETAKEGLLVLSDDRRFLGHRDKQAMFRSLLSGVPIRIQADRCEQGVWHVSVGAQHLEAFIALAEGRDVIGLGKPYGQDEISIDELDPEVRTRLLHTFLVEIYEGSSYVVPYSTYLGA